VREGGGQSDDQRPEHQWALAGVRLSFALGYWLELAACYPEAMQALTAVRDRKAQALTGGKGSFELFHDVAAINGYLHAEPETVALFKQLHQIEGNSPQAARRCFAETADAAVSKVPSRPEGADAAVLLRGLTLRGGGRPGD
jgi:hypothetical protein